ncbi:MAG TPA: AAA family ATPase [Pyrinomonadaceae bacterium]|jgi:LuxR family maltose regulon positive regulatory protein|nr:AAA family ATPase [Pyrinomonadaceae bacterium]
MQLILDKITTPAQMPRISRLRLLNTLHGSLASCTSTIINGRAGTGKTMLATDFARRSGRRVAWYKVDASDGDLRVFFQYLIESVRRERPRFGYEMLVRLLAETSAPEDVPLLAESFVYELIESGSDPLLIVIDDLHLVYDAEWVVPFFRRLLPLLPPEAHMLIMGRSLPPGPLWRMRSKQTLCVIEEAVMAFTQEEAKRLFTSYGLSEGQAMVALGQTRGRAASLDRAAALLNAPVKMAAAAAQNARKRRRIKRASVLQIHGYLI